MRITVNTKGRWEWDPKEKGEPIQDNQKVVFTYNKPKSYKRSEWSRTCAVRQPNGSISTFIDRDVKAIILESDVNIENLTVVENGVEKEIKTGVDLCDCVSDVTSMLVERLAYEITRNDYEGELKN